MKLIFTDKGDLQVVTAELYGINDVMLLGQNLGIHMSTLETIAADSCFAREGLKRVIYHWLMRSDERPTWSVLANAVSPINHALAKRIRDKYCR